METSSALPLGRVLLLALLWRLREALTLAQALALRKALLEALLERGGEALPLPQEDWLWEALGEEVTAGEREALPEPPGALTLALPVREALGEEERLALLGAVREVKGEALALEPRLPEELALRGPLPVALGLALSLDAALGEPVAVPCALAVGFTPLPLPLGVRLWVSVARRDCSPLTLAF